MTIESKHTAGPAIVSGCIRDVSGDQLWCGAVEPSVAIGGYRGSIAHIQSAAQIGGISNDEAEANANLIAEAFNVAHETGLTPRQLANDLRATRSVLAATREHITRLEVEFDELRKQCAALLALLDEYAKRDGGQKFKDLRLRARAALSAWESGND